MEYITQVEIDTFIKIKGEPKSSISEEDKGICKLLRQKLDYLSNTLGRELAVSHISKAPSIFNPSGTSRVKKSLWYRIFPNQIWLNLKIALTFSFDGELNIMLDSWNWDSKSKKRKNLLDLRTKIIKRITSEELLKYDDYNQLNQQLISYYEEVLMPIEDEILEIARDFNNRNIGLLATDGTDWKEQHIKESLSYKYSIVWNHRQPNGQAKTITYLKNTIKRIGYFDLYYLSKNTAKYKAQIIDIAMDDSELERWSKEYGPDKIRLFKPSMSNIKDGTKKAKIVFLCKSLQRLNPEIIKTNLVPIQGGYQSQGNLVPFFMEINELTKNSIMSIEEYNDKEFNKNKTIPLNQIFFGPPGTGKTHQTIAEAIRIINPNFNLNQNREIVKEEFDRLKELGRIVFTTFHQSMSYEDFIEGIKPVPPKNDENVLSYRVEDGIFKKICQVAGKKNRTINKLEFAEKYKEFVEKLPSHEEQDSDFVLKTPNGYDFWLYQNSAKSICVKAGTKADTMSLALSELEKREFWI